MKSVAVPSRPELQRAYETLQWDREIPDLRSIVIWSHWCRIDSRLAEIIVRFLEKNFRRIHPTLLWEENIISPQPQCLAVLVDFARIKAKNDAKNALIFEQWANAVNIKVSKAATQLFFLREGSPKPDRDQYQMERTLRTFQKWGFIGAESPLSEKNSSTTTLLCRAARISILEKLVREKSFFSVRDYISACEGKIHSRTAERDLLHSRLIATRGNTRARRYFACGRK